MKRERDINWFLSEPTRLMEMKPFTRGGTRNLQGYEKLQSGVLNNTMLETGFASLNLNPISQDLYITEYRPDLHHIILNKTIPHIKIVLDGQELPTNMMEITQTASFQKLIHSAHVRNLTANNLEFNLFNPKPEDGERKVFDEIKQEWLWRNCEWNKYMAINTCKQLGNCGLLFSYDKELGKYTITNFSYEDGYQMTPNYDEYGNEVARSLFYQIDNKIVIDTFDNKKHYRSVQGEKGWEHIIEPHGFSRNPLLIKRGKVAWEYAESSIEMWELMANINAIALKRFGTFALAFWGEMDKGSLKRDSSTLIVNLSSDTTNGKQDVKVLDFPEPQTMDGYLKTLEEKISLFSSTSFITPKDITTTNSGGNGIALAMSNDYSLAVQSAMDWQRFVNDMVYLHQEGLDLEKHNGAQNYSKVRIGAKIIPWSLETTNTKLVNLGMEAPYLSTQTVLEKCPDAAPDEVERVIKERGALTSRNDKTANQAAQTAENLANNRNDMIIDNQPNEQNV